MAETFARLEHEYVVFVLGRFPVVATYLGGAAYDAALADIDGKLRDHSPLALEAEDSALRDFRRRFAALDPAALPARRRIDRSVALAQIDFLLRQHETRRHQERALDTYVDEPFRGVDWQIQGMTATGESTYGTEPEWRALIARVDAVPAYLAVAETQIAAGLRSGNPPDGRVLRQFGLDGARADRDYFARTLSAIAARNLTGANRAALLAEVQAAGSRAAEAYGRLSAFIAATFFEDVEKPGAGGLKPAFRADRFAFGATEYDWALGNNLRLDTTAARLFEESWPIVEETRRSMVALASQIASERGWQVPGDGHDAVRMVFERLGEDAPRSDDAMIALYREAGARLVEYARRTALFDVPAEYRLDVTITPPPLRASIEGAAYYPAPPFKKTGVGRYYVTPTGNDLAELRQEHNHAAVADLAAHEGFPGHDWHYKVMAQHAAEISPLRWLTPGAVEDSSSMWEDSMAAEGWALYAEALVAEPQPGMPDGFYTRAEQLYQLRGKLYRDLRVRIDTGIHTGRLSFDDAVSLFSEVVDFQPGACSEGRPQRGSAKEASCRSARAAVTRYARWPTQAITYRLGKDQIFALRARARQELGAKFSSRAFHLEFMKQGTIPAGYFAEELLRALRK